MLPAFHTQKNFPSNKPEFQVCAKNTDPKLENWDGDLCVSKTAIELILFNKPKNNMEINWCFLLIKTKTFSSWSCIYFSDLRWSWNRFLRQTVNQFWFLFVLKKTFSRRFWFVFQMIRHEVKAFLFDKPKSRKPILGSVPICWRKHF